MRGLIAVGAASVSSVMGSSVTANPIRRVVTLMQDMQKEIEAEGEKEKELYEKFMCYCKGNTDNMSKSAEDASATIEEMSAKVKAEKAEKEQVAGELKQHKADRADAKQDLEKATKIRKKENETYVEAAGDAKANIDAMNGAITSLEKGMGAGSFIQTAFASKLKSIVASLSAIDANDREEVMAFLEQSGDYIPQSGQIVGILKNMKDEMDKSLGGIVSDEETAAAGFAELKASKNKEIAAASAAIESKTERAGQLAVSIVQAQNAADDATKELSDAEKFLANLKVACKEKTTDFEERTKTRQDEIMAISEAIAILNDDDALDIFKKSLPSPPSAPQAFLQKGNAQSKATAVSKARALITNTAFKTPALNLLAHTLKSKLRTGSQVDFSSVLKMIDDMVTLLKKEGEDDATHKKFCDGEFDSSSDEKKATEDKLASLASAISEMNDEISSLKDAIAKTTAEIKALDESVADATAQRKTENAEYTETMQLNEAAIQLIFKAQNRMNKFYNPDQYQGPKMREPTAEERAAMAAGEKVDLSAPPQMIAGTTQMVFIQLHSQSAEESLQSPPETYGEFKPKTQKSNGVIGLMKMLINDLEKDIQEAEHIEKTATKDYQELVSDAQESRAQNVKSISDKESTKAEIEGKLQEAKTSSVVTNDAYEQVKNYIADLHNSCDFIVAQFEVRKEARTNEIESLKNAKAVLSGASYSL
jgi:septal ring factor EnvC (AmiA/AmiB activator)